MVNLTDKWALPLFVDTDVFDPIQTPLGLMSTATEAAITKVLAMGLPKVPGQAARDALYPSGVVIQGDGVYRSDLGYEERYYTAYNATTNPGGQWGGAGWYRPIPVPTVGVFGADAGVTLGANTYLDSINGFVTLTFQATRVLSFSGNSTIGGLSAGFRPRGDTYFGGTSYGTGQPVGIRVASSGLVDVQAAPAGHTVVAGSVTFKAA